VTITANNMDTETNFFPSFPPQFLVSTSLFLCKIEEANICLLMYAHPLNESLRLYLMNPKKEWFGPIWVFKCLFNESKERKLRGFSILESLKNT
jgi:hypothetical protein